MEDPTDPRPSECRRVLNADQSRALARAALVCLGKSLRRRAIRRAEATASEDWDEEEEERAQAAGEELNCVHSGGEGGWGRVRRVSYVRRWCLRERERER